MPSRRKKWVGRVAVAAVLAVVLHGAAVVLFALSFGEMTAPLRSSGPMRGRAPTAQGASAEDDDRPMEISSIVDQLERPDERSALEKAREEEAKKEEEEKNAKGQVVDIAKPPIEQRPDQAKYTAEYDSKVDKEMRGPTARDRAGASQEKVGAPNVLPVPPQPPSKDSTSDGRPDARPGRPGPLAMRDLERRQHEAASSGDNDEPAERDGERPRAGERGLHPSDRRPQAAPGEGGNGAPPGFPGARGEGQKAPNLAATPDMLQKAIGKGSGSMDYLKDVDDGEYTAVNAKKWVHAGFFNRVKRQVADNWHPEVVYLRHDPSGNVYGVKDRVTVLRIHMKPDGHLAGWTMMQSSGVDFLDDEAIDAFRKAQPFPNPPKALIESDGQIHFNFAFIFELSGRTNMKIFKY